MTTNFLDLTHVETAQYTDLERFRTCRSCNLARALRACGPCHFNHLDLDALARSEIERAPGTLRAWYLLTGLHVIDAGWALRKSELIAEGRRIIQRHL